MEARWETEMEKARLALVVQEVGLELERWAWVLVLKEAAEKKMAIVAMEATMEEVMVKVEMAMDA